MKDPKTFLTKLNWKINGRVFGWGASPEADWKIIFISTAALIVLIVILSVFMFRQIDKEGIFITEKPTGQEKRALDTSLLKETVLYYQQKALELKKVKESVFKTADPSL
ncbi:MAG: hypothetical protein HYX23_02095 [Candidatus Zambryskibacteria bacterium]|nr:hypothetical protein [Candidatus Zambryskibacteria bacterium]